MCVHDTSLHEGLQSAPRLALDLRNRLSEFLSPLLTELDEKLDRRLVGTFRAAIEVILLFRDRPHGLLLSELGSYLLGPHRAPAGTKRLSNLLRSGRWEASFIRRFLWRQADERLKELESEHQEPLLLWDQSVIEKPESIKAEGLCAVRSTKAARLKRIKPGFYNPPGGRPVFVPGIEWVGLMLCGQSGPAQVASMRWWTKRGERTEDLRTVQGSLLLETAQAWGKRVLHVFDRGFAGAPWLMRLFEQRLRFAMRWPKGYKLLDQDGQERPAWQIARGKRSWDHKEIYDAHQQACRKVGILVFEVGHPAIDEPVWLVVARTGGGREPWYLLTNEPIWKKADAWKLYFAYHRRWQVEMAFRFNKCELALESPRLWTWEGRMKLMGMVTLAYAFLLLLVRESKELIERLLRYFCHRTGKRGREVSAPLYRMRSALSRLWSNYPAQPHAQTPG